MTDHRTPQGWFPDPAGQPFLRWWDGQQWTAHTNAGTTGNGPQPVRPVPSTPVARSALPPPIGPSVSHDDAERRKGALFSGKRHLEDDVVRLQNLVDSMGVTECEQLRGELDHLRAVLPAMRSECDSLAARLEPLRAETRTLETARVELSGLRQEVEQLRTERRALTQEMAECEQLRQQRTMLVAEVAELRREVV